MRVSWRTAFAVGPVLVSAILPSSYWSDTGDPNNERLPGSQTHDKTVLELHEPTSIRVKIPCQSCSDSDNDEESALFLDIQALPGHLPCGQTNIKVNDVVISEAWTGYHGQGRVSIAIPRPGDQQPRTIAATWNSICAHAQLPPDYANPDLLVIKLMGQILSFSINEIDGKALQEPTGFTLSSRQFLQPQLLRFEPEPLDLAPGRLGSVEGWMYPSKQDSLFWPPKSALDEVPVSMELERMKYQVKELTDTIQQKTAVLEAQQYNRKQPLKEQLARCKDVKCMARAVMETLQGKLKSICPTHKPKKDQSHSKGKNCTKNASQPLASATSSAVPQPTSRPSSTALPGSHPPDEQLPVSPLNSHFAPSDLDIHQPPSPPSITSWVDQIKTASPARKSLWVLQILTFILLPISIFLCCLRRRCTESQRADRRWLREARRNARAVHNAQRRKAWRDWWNNLGRDRRIVDYEEKRALIRQQEAVLEDAMQAEIRELRQAADLVAGLADPEQGRLSGNPSASSSSLASSHRAQLQAAQARSSLERERQHLRYHQHRPHRTPEEPPRLHRTPSLPSYRSRSRSRAGSLSGSSEAGYSEQLPTYDDDAADEEMHAAVADGFRYTPSRVVVRAGTDATPESSVVATSSRASSEVGGEKS